MATVSAKNWMSGIDGQKSLAELSVLGTHESGALFGASSKCQNRGVLWQLLAGARFLDLRCSYSSGTEPLYIYHSSDYQYSTFTDLQNDCIAFLDDNEDETILVNIQQTHSDVDAATFWGRFDALANHDYWSFVEQIPKVGDNQKKMVLVRPCRRNLTLPNKPVIAGLDWSGHGLEWNGFAVSGESWNDLFQTQNYWHGLGGSATGPGGMGDGPGGVGGINGTDKGNYVEQFIKDAVDGSNPGKLYMNFLSRADTSIGDAAADMNKRISTYIQQIPAHPGPLRMGILAIDFSGNTGDGPGCLEDVILSVNPYVQGTSFSYAGPEPSPPSFKLQLTVAGQPSGWMMVGQGDWADFLTVSNIPTADSPVELETYSYGGVDYFKVKNESSYLSVSKDGQAGFFGWDGASTFKKVDKWLFSDYNGNPLRVRTSGELWCGHEGDLVEVAYVPS